MRPTRSCSGREVCTPASLRMKQEYTDRLNRRIQSVAFAGQPVDEDPVVEQQDHRRRLRRVIRLLNCGVENRHAVRKVQVKRADSRNKQGVWLRVRRRWSPERRLCTIGGAFTQKVVESMSSIRWTANTLWVGERCVCAPHSIVLGTSTSPRLSVSFRTSTDSFVELIS